MNQRAYRGGQRQQAQIPFQQPAYFGEQDSYDQPVSLNNASEQFGFYDQDEQVQYGEYDQGRFDQDEPFGYEQERYDYDAYHDYTDIGSRPRHVVDLRMAILLCGILIVGAMAMLVVSQLLLPGSNGNQQGNDSLYPPSSGEIRGQQPANIVPNTISAAFMPSVLAWEPLIVNWANVYQVDPNAVATIMQIESCGYQDAQSHAGAMGLFQVMPFHFSSGENMLDPNTNARRGVSYFAEGMQMTGGDPYLSFAGYNGGHGTAARGWNSWPTETQRYYNWSKGIYEEVSRGDTTSQTLQDWLNAGGRSLCSQAEAQLNLY